MLYYFVLLIVRMLFAFFHLWVAATAWVVNRPIYDRVNESFGEIAEKIMPLEQLPKLFRLFLNSNECDAFVKVIREKVGGVWNEIRKKARTVWNSDFWRGLVISIISYIVIVSVSWLAFRLASSDAYGRFKTFLDVNIFSLQPKNKVFIWLKYLLDIPIDKEVLPSPVVNNVAAGAGVNANGEKQLPSAPSSASSASESVLHESAISAL